MKDAHYILEGHEPVKVSLMTWARWFDTHLKDRIVAQTQVAAGVRVSTVFLGIDHSFSGKGPPILFESMVFDDYGDQDCRRYCTWAEAEEGHLQLVDELEARLAMTS